MKIIKICRIITLINLLLIAPIISLLLISIAIPLAFLGGGLKETASLLREYQSSVQSVCLWAAKLSQGLKREE